jgi:hypothetical protein
VYYYQNNAGSRVFFDEIGWPWPKHPCTDRGQRLQISSICPAPKLEAERDMYRQEASEFDLDLNQSFAKKFGQSAWHLMQAAKCFRNGKINLVVSESIENGSRSYFQFTSVKRVLKQGDVFAKKGSKISLLDRSSLIPRQYEITIIRKLRELVDLIPTR